MVITMPLFYLRAMTGILTRNTACFGRWFGVGNDRQQKSPLQFLTVGFLLIVLLGVSFSEGIFKGFDSGQFILFVTFRCHDFIARCREGIRYFPLTFRASSVQPIPIVFDQCPLLFNGVLFVTCQSPARPTKAIINENVLATGSIHLPLPSHWLSSFFYPTYQRINQTFLP